MAEAERPCDAWRPLSHYLPRLTMALYEGFRLGDGEPVVEPLPGGAGATVSFEAGGRPFTAHLPGVSLQEARMRAYMARRLLHGARAKELQAVALLRTGPAPTTET